jgi:hypothetical protein
VRLAILAAAATVAWGQTDRVLQLTQDGSKQEIERIADVLRTAADIQRVTIDQAKGALTVEGTAAQTALADWLVRQLDLPPNGPFSGVHEYRPPAGGDDVARVFYLTHGGSAEDMQYMVTAIRMLEQKQRLQVYNPLHAVVVRGTGQQTALAAWLADQLDHPANEPAPPPHVYRISADDEARVFALTYPETTPQLQDIVVAIRSLGDISPISFCPARRAIALRATAERAALAEWLVHELDQPVNGAAQAKDTAPHQYLLPNDPDNVVRIFYLSRSLSGQDLNKIGAAVRSTARAGRMCIYSALPALAIRGTAGQVLTAERVLEEMKAQ